jgi:hypothetical protein
MEWTSQRRVRLQAMSGALLSAVAMHKTSDANRFVAELEELLPTVPDEYSRAVVGVELADSLHKLGNAIAARARLDEARALAASQSFHEILHRAEQVSSAWCAEPAPIATPAADNRKKRPYRSEHFRMVLRSLKGLTSATL